MMKSSQAVTVLVNRIKETRQPAALDELVQKLAEYQINRMQPKAYVQVLTVLTQANYPN